MDRQNLKHEDQLDGIADEVRGVLLLAERLREQRGGELDDESLIAVAEATGTPVEYVRVLAGTQVEHKKKGLLNNLRSAFFTLEPHVRTAVMTALAATFSALFHVFAMIQAGAGATFFDSLALICAGLAIWNISLARDRKDAALGGALFGGVLFVTLGLFAYIVQASWSVPSFLLVAFLAGGALGGLFVHRMVRKWRKRLGIEDPLTERQELLRQLVTIQDKLRTGEQSATFVSVDVVGSTQIKAQSDPLSVEFTFNEYHLFLEMVAKRYQGHVHSTAGDGAILAFDQPQQAFAAARNLQTGILELNTFRNKTGTPLVLRVGLHTGTVVAPQAGDLGSVNFAHVIDVAAHLQKVCPAGGIAVSDAAAVYLPGGPASVGVQKVRAADISGTIWLPRHAVRALAESGPSPVPEGLG